MMRKRPFFSVIVPVYNSEQYLHHCVDSILAQKNADFELLLINDGSTDSSGAICDEYARKDTRIRVYHKENGGVSAARNLGLENAEGEWVTFVDSDDELQNIDALHISNVDSDMILFALKMVNADGTTYCDPLRTLPASFDTKKNYIKEYLHFHVFNSACAKLVKRSLLKDLRFDSAIKFGEDALFNLKLMKLIDRITVCDEVVYNYHRFEDYGIKYQTTIENSVNTMYQIFEAYWALECRNLPFERNVFHCYRTICRDEWIKNPMLWNKNKIVEFIYEKIKDAYPILFRIKYRLVATQIYRQIKISNNFIL